MADKFGILTGSTNGRGIKVASTGPSGTGGTTIHTHAGGTTVADWVTILAYNSDSVQRIVTMQWGGITSVDDEFATPIPSRTGLILVADRLPIDNGLIIKAFADAANVIVLWGGPILNSAL